MKVWCVAATYMLASTALGQSGDDLVRAVNYVMFNDDQAREISVVDRDTCVFEDKRGGYKIFLNNVDPRTVKYVRVTDDMMKVWFTGVGNISTLKTSQQFSSLFMTGPSRPPFDEERLGRAWKFIYGKGGCKAASPPF